MWPQLRSGRLRAVDAGITVSVYGSGGIHEYLDLNLNRGGSAYHEYEYEKARPIMSLNSKKTQNSSVFNLNTGLFMTCSGCVLLCVCLLAMNVCANISRRNFDQPFVAYLRSATTVFNLGSRYRAV